MLLVTASALLALVAGRRGAVVLGEGLGESLGRAAAPSRRHVRDLYGFPEDSSDAPGPAALEGEHVSAAPGLPTAGVTPGQARSRSPDAAVAVRTRGVHVPALVVMAYAKRGVVPAVDSREGVRLRGVIPGSGLVDGDLLLRVGRAQVRSIREVVGIVTSAMLAGQTQLSGVVRRGEDEISVTVEIPTGAEPAPPPN